jgi:hypothetical protein
MFLWMKNGTIILLEIEIREIKASSKGNKIISTKPGILQIKRKIV